MNGNLETISSCLFDAFANQYLPEGNPFRRNPQDERFMWAIQEGIRRIDRYLVNWSAHQANKNHECIRGCQIKIGDMYFHSSYGSSFTDYLKLCAGCMAMLLYFMDVEKLPPYLYTHWDRTKGEAVFVGDSSERSGLPDLYS